jgi:hypothetical protein
VTSGKKSSIKYKNIEELNKDAEVRYVEVG